MVFGAVELTPVFAPRRIEVVVFDFDGTLSWLRHGWPAIMLGIFLDRLPRRPGESEASARAALLDIVLGLNGVPTLRQMACFSDLVRDRGGVPPKPEILLAIYQDQLDVLIASRIDAVRSGRSSADDFVVHGARPLLDRLRREAIPCAILSTTAEDRVKDEAEVLGLSSYFEGRIHGGSGDPLRFSKMDVFRRILSDAGFSGSRLLSFGDGPVEIRDTKSLGGVAIAVCSDEDQNGSGVMDPYKRRQLLDAGADAAIPDYRDAPALLDRLRPA